MSKGVRLWQARDLFGKDGRHSHTSPATHLWGRLQFSWHRSARWNVCGSKGRTAGAFNFLFVCFETHPRLTTRDIGRSHPFDKTSSANVLSGVSRGHDSFRDAVEDEIEMKSCITEDKPGVSPDYHTVVEIRWRKPGRRSRSHGAAAWPLKETVVA